MTQAAEREAALHALAGRIECPHHLGVFLEPGERCSECLITRAPSKLLDQLVRVAVLKEPIDMAELAQNVVGSVLGLGRQSELFSGRSALKPPTRRARKRRRGPARKALLRRA